MGGAGYRIAWSRVLRDELGVIVKVISKPRASDGFHDSTSAFDCMGSEYWARAGCHLKEEIQACL